MKDNKPIMSKRLGRFQISAWNCERIRRARDDGFDCEKPYEFIRVCIQYSRYNRRTGMFERQQIWCSPDELRILAELLEKDADEEGTKPADVGSVSDVIGAIAHAPGTHSQGE